MPDQISVHLNLSDGPLPNKRRASCRTGGRDVYNVGQPHACGHKSNAAQWEGRTAERKRDPGRMASGAGRPKTSRLVPGAHQHPVDASPFDAAGRYGARPASTGRKPILPVKAARRHFRRDLRMRVFSVEDSSGLAVVGISAFGV